MTKSLALLVALAAGAHANVCNSGCAWDALAANAEAPTATCGGRITWLQNNRGLGAAAACNQVADEFPSECGSCAGGDAPAPAPPVQPGADLEVATFNLYEWHVGANNRWGALYDKIQSQTFDIIGFQEATGVANVINSVPRMAGWSYYEPTTIGGYNDNPSPIAWDSDRFALLASGWREVGSDQWGARGVAWVRLRDASSGSTIFFANTHGPLGSCSSTLGDNWLRVVTDNIVQGDMLVYVGDWNCGLASAALNVLTAQYTVAVDGGIDIIFTNGVEAAASRVDNGYPSDHPFVAASFEGTTTVPAPTPRLRGTPSPKPTVRPTVKPTAEPTDPATQYKCGVATCTDEIWNTYVQGPNAYAPCGGRIEWVESNMGMSEADACQFVGEEFPEVCGPCAPRGVEEAEPTPRPSPQPSKEPTRAPTPRPTSKPTNKPTIKPTAPPTREPTKEPTKEPTRQPTRPPSDAGSAVTSFGVNYATGLMDDPPRTFEEHLEFARKAAERGLCKIKLWTCDDVELFEALQQAYDEAGLLDCLEVMIHVPNGRVAAVAYEAGEASDIIATVAPYAFIKAVVVGNELDFASTAVPGDQAALDALPRALENMKAAGSLRVTTAFSNAIVTARNGDWSDTIVRPERQATVRACLDHVDYFMFEPVSKDWVLGDGAWPGSTTSSILESQLGNMRKALRDLSSTFGDMPLTVGETGWASCGTDYATVANSRRYYENTLGGLDAWTTAYNLVPGEWYLFELFDEKRKPGSGLERCFGILNQDGSAKPGLTEFVLAPTAPAAPTPRPTAVAGQKCGVATCTAEVLDTYVQGPNANAPCGGRIDWVVANMQMSEADACQYVGEEFPDVCGPCAPRAIVTREPTKKPTRPPSSPTNGGVVHAMSYNTEYIGYPCCGSSRVPSFGAKITEVLPDVVGLQECQDANLLASYAPGYAVLPNTGGGNNILYKTSSVEALESGRMGITSDCYAARTVSWGMFRVKATGDVFWLFNTHLPHNGCDATDRNTHARIARALVDKRNELGAGGTPTIVTGDCNPFASNGASEGTFESNLDDRGISRVYMGTGQFGGYGGLDKIFASDGDWTVQTAGDHGTGASDHPAISAELRLN